MPNDMFLSKKNYNQYCKWWKRAINEENTDDEFIMKRIPTGTFYAKEVAPLVSSSEIMGDSFMFEKNNITLKSPYNLLLMEKNDLVEYNGEKWIVENVQKPKARIQNTFFASEKHCSHYFYIELRK